VQPQQPPTRTWFWCTRALLVCCTRRRDASNSLCRRARSATAADSSTVSATPCCSLTWGAAGEGAIFRLMSWTGDGGRVGAGEGTRDYRAATGKPKPHRSAANSRARAAPTVQRRAGTKRASAPVSVCVCAPVCRVGPMHVNAGLQHAAPPYNVAVGVLPGKVRMAKLPVIRPADDLAEAVHVKLPDEGGVVVVVEVLGQRFVAKRVELGGERGGGDGAQRNIQPKHLLEHAEAPQQWCRDGVS
jgi:hypothetical protein